MYFSLYFIGGWGSRKTAKLQSHPDCTYNVSNIKSTFFKCEENDLKYIVKQFEDARRNLKHHWIVFRVGFLAEYKNMSLNF